MIYLTSKTPEKWREKQPSGKCPQWEQQQQKKTQLKENLWMAGLLMAGLLGTEAGSFLLWFQVPKEPAVPALSVLCWSQLSGKEQPLRWQCFLWASLFSLKFIAFLFVALGLHCCSCFFLAGARGLLSSRGVQASHGGGFSCCRANSRVLDFQ